VPSEQVHLVSGLETIFNHLIFPPFPRDIPVMLCALMFFACSVLVRIIALAHIVDARGLSAVLLTQMCCFMPKFLQTMPGEQCRVPFRILFSTHVLDVRYPNVRRARRI
jgi:hypothetical protein